MQKPIKNYSQAKYSNLAVTHGTRNLPPTTTNSIVTNLLDAQHPDNLLETINDVYKVFEHTPSHMATPTKERHLRNVDIIRYMLRSLSIELTLQKTNPQKTNTKNTNSMENSIFNYNGNNITFQNGDNILINATEMAKQFGKKPANWLRTEQSKELIKAVTASHKCTPPDLVHVINGGDNFGTWMHEDVALLFAQWLSPEFYLWCNDRIKELLKLGITALNPEKLINDPDFAISILTKLKEERAEKKLLEISNKQYSEQIKIAAPKVNYYDDVMQSKDDYTTTTIAKELGMTAIALNKKLNEMKIIYRADSHWVLHRKYQHKGYTNTRTAIFEGSNGDRRSSINTVWTEKGRQFIHSIY